VAGLAARFSAAGVAVTLTREPGGTALGDAIRALFLEPGLTVAPAAEPFLLNASRAQLVAETIRPALGRGATVICDRYIDATLAYQGYGRGLDLDRLRSLCEIATGGLLPDKTLLVDLPVDEAFARLDARGRARDRLEREDRAFHERVRAGYLRLSRGDPRFTVLDGRASPGDLADAAWRALAPSPVRP
jgi:dTMP kinase